MDFSKALEALKAGKKVKLPEFEEGTYLELKNGNYYIKYKSGSIKNYFSAIPIRYTLAEDWEIVEDIQEVPIKITVSETFTCPSCKTSGEYWPSNKEDVDAVGYFFCGKCGQKIKPCMPSDKEILTYLKTELGREFKSYIGLNNNIIEMCINPPDTITLTNTRGATVKYIKDRGG